MRTPRTIRALEDFGRIRLSRNFFMRDFLYSDIATMERFANLPDDPDLAIAAGRGLCENLLEPLQATFGRIAIRSAYRSAEVNGFGNAHGNSCASNEADRAYHIWDQRSRDGGMGAMATIVIPWLIDKHAEGVEWPAMAWWIHDHLPYSELQFPKLLAFNIGWHELPRRRITSFVAPRGLLTKPGMANHAGDHSQFYPASRRFVRTCPDASAATGPDIVRSFVGAGQCSTSFAGFWGSPMFWSCWRCCPPARCRWCRNTSNRWSTALRRPIPRH